MSRSIYQVVFSKYYGEKLWFVASSLEGALAKARIWEKKHPDYGHEIDSIEKQGTIDL